MLSILFFVYMILLGFPASAPCQLKKYLALVTRAGAPKNFQTTKGKTRQHVPNVVCYTDAAFLLAFLRTCKFRLEKTKRELDDFMTIRNAMPEFFDNWDPMNQNNQTVLCCGAYLPLPGYNYQGHKVILLRAGAYDPNDIPFNHYMKACMMVASFQLKDENQLFVTGCIIIVDMKGCNLDHITKLIPAIPKLLVFFKGSLHSAVKNIIYINTPPIFQTLNAVFASFLTEKMKNRIILNSDDNYETLQKQVSKNVLPSNYEGDGKSIAEITEYWRKHLEENRDYLLHEEKINKADESKRPGRPKTSQELSGIEGSFRKLDID